jgi:hypothetical protein
MAGKPREEWLEERAVESAVKFLHRRVGGTSFLALSWLLLCQLCLMMRPFAWWLDNVFFVFTVGMLLPRLLLRIFLYFCPLRFVRLRTGVQFLLLRFVCIEGVEKEILEREVKLLVTFVVMQLGTLRNQVSEQEYRQIMKHLLVHYWPQIYCQESDFFFLFPPEPSRPIV